MNLDQALLQIGLDEIRKQLPLFKEANACTESELEEMVNLVINEIYPCIQLSVHEIMGVYFEGQEQPNLRAEACM